METDQHQRSLTPHQKRQIAALERAHKLRQEIRTQSGKALDRINWVDLLNKMRDERDAELLRGVFHKPAP